MERNKSRRDTKTNDKEVVIMGHKYKTRYKLEPEAGEFTAEEIREGGIGGCDALVLYSLIFPEDGSYSQTFFSFDGRTGGGPVNSNDLWKIWSLMTKNLIDRKDDLSVAKYSIAEGTWELIKELFKS